MQEFLRTSVDTRCFVQHLWFIYILLELWNRRFSLLPILTAFRRGVLGLIYSIAFTVLQTLLVYACATQRTLVYTFVTPKKLALATFTRAGVKMGNDTSSIPSDCTTPTSEWQSVQSFGSKRRSSVSSTRLPTPTEPPEPDLSHLTEDEITQIQSVLGRAEQMQQEEHKRIRDLEMDYTAYALTIEQRLQQVEPEFKDVPLCPLCLKNELRVDASGAKKGQNICVDCENLTCAECGTFQGSLTTKLQEWVCTACQKRRKLVLSTGLWHPGIEPTAAVPLSKEIESRLDVMKGSKTSSERGSKSSLDKSSSEPETEDNPKKTAKLQNSLPCAAAAQSQDRDSRPILTGLPVQERPIVPTKESVMHSSTGSRESFGMQESPMSEEAPSTSNGQSRLRGVLMTMVGSCAMGQRPQSDSETSASDVDMEDVSMQYYHGDGMSTDEVSDDYSMMSIGSSDDSGRLRRKHRPKSLNIPRSHSATSSDDELTDTSLSTDTENRLAPLAIMNEARVALAASAFAEEMEDFKAESSVDEVNEKYDSDLQDDLKTNLSPSPPRSPSWRVGLESPPFSPKRKDSYPGKKRPSSPVSPKDSRLHFTYDISPPSGQLLLSSELYEEAQSHGDINYAGMAAAQKPSPMSPEELSCNTMTSTGEPLFLKMPIPESRSNHDLHELDIRHNDLPESAVAIDLATYAATIASNTANLTQMTVSPTNLHVIPIHENEQISPDSQDTESTESASPISPGYYDNAPDDMDEVELADPSSKSIDYQGSKRNKVKPPSTDWSPVIDLSPILDVSPSIEEAEQEDMFEKQEEERRRRESQEEDEDDDEEYENYFQPVDDEDEKITYYGLKRYDRVENICQLLQNPDINGDVVDSSLEASSNGDNSNGFSAMPLHPFTCTTLASKSVTTDTVSKSQVYSVSNSEPQTTNTINHGRVNKSAIETTDKNGSANSGYCEKQKPPIRPRRKLPEPTAEMIAASTKTKPKVPPPIPPKPSILGGLSKHIVSSSGNTFVKVAPPVQDSMANNNNNINNNNNNNVAEASKCDDPPHDKSPIQKQDSDEKRRKAKDLKAKPNPLVIRHIESEEQSMSPQYKVLDSPPSPESRSSLKRDYSDSTSVSPSSSPDREVYPFPSPVTPPDSDSSPPKPHSPSSPGTDFDDDVTYDKPTTPKRLPHVNKSFEEKSMAESKVRDKIRKFEQASSQESKKTRRKLPPIPTGSDEATGNSKPKNHHPASSRKAYIRAENRRKRVGYGTPSSTSDESMNEDDFEVAMWTNQRRSSDDKPTSMDKRNGNYINAEILDRADKNSKKSIAKELRNIMPPDKELPPPPCMATMTLLEKNDQLIKDKDETDEIIDSLISIYGEPITQAMKSLKKRLQDELRRATEGRRRRIEEFEEIRALQLQIGELKLSSEYQKAQMKRSMQQQRSGKQVIGQNGKKRGSSPLSSSRSAPQVVPRRGSRHKRQTSDPMISKFSPIKEDKDIESDLQHKVKTTSDQVHIKYITDDSSQSGLSDNESIRSEPVVNARYKKIKPSAYAKMFFNTETKEDTNLSGTEPSLLPGMKSKCHSESHLAGKTKKSHAHHSPSCYDIDEEIRFREERKQQLQNEIEKRKRQLEETSRLQAELLHLTRSGHVMAHSYDDIPRTSAYSYPPTRPIPTGIIKPLEDDDDISDYEYGKKKQDYEDGSWENVQQEANYSSTEYLAHKQEASRRRVDELQSAYSSPYLYGNVDDSHAFKPTKQNVEYYRHPDPGRDPVMSSSVTLPELHTARPDVEFVPAKDTFSDTETSPPSDSTPAMPLLDDVKARSRKIIHDIGTGSRPVSAEFNFTGGVDAERVDRLDPTTDLLNAMHRVESDNSVDADEPIMKHMTEGGVTILKQLERRKPPQPTQPKKYDFPTKRILLTRDPKDRSIKGNGIGMKIVGGKTVPGTTAVGAYVTAIYPGGVAEQLHGELQIGDQIIEWNGVELSSRSYEEVQQIICQPNGEIELVVRPGPRSSSRTTEEGPGGSVHSSYDNLDYVPDEVYEKCLKSQHGVDPKQLAAQLEGIQEDASPEASQSSSQQEFLTPSMSSPCSSPHSDPTSTSSDRQRNQATATSTDKQISVPERQEEDNIQPAFHQDQNLGEIQLQLSHDDFDNTLNIHVIQAKNLTPRDINGLSDPFVKLYLLPGRCPENKRRTKHISRTLNPEWHQTVMFQDIHREELQYKTLEITLWDYDRFKTNDFLGEVVIDLSVPGFLDNLPHWYPLREHDNTTGVELPKPTVLPPTIRTKSDIGRKGSPNLSRGAMGSPGRQSACRGGKTDGMGGRRRSLGTLTDVDRLTSSDSLDISSTHSSPLLPHKPRDMHLQSAHAPGKVANCFSGLSHILSVARHLVSPRSKKNKYCARLSHHRLLPKTNSENRSMKTYWQYHSFG